MGLEGIPRLTREQAAIIGAYTGITCGPFQDVHELAEQLLGGFIWTHEFADPVIVERLKDAAKPHFLALCFTKDEEARG